MIRGIRDCADQLQPPSALDGLAMAYHDRKSMVSWLCR